MKALPFTSRTSQNIFFKTAFLLFSILIVLSCTKDSDDDLFEKTSQEQAIKYELTIVVSPTEGGIITQSGGEYKRGSILQLMAIPAEGYIFSKWTGSIQSAANLITITMNSHMDITAVFELRDKDGDGVADNIDECPDTPANDIVDEVGCTIDEPDPVPPR